MLTIDGINYKLSCLSIASLSGFTWYSRKEDIHTLRQTAGLFTIGFMYFQSAVMLACTFDQRGRAKGVLLAADALLVPLLGMVWLGAERDMPIESFDVLQLGLGLMCVSYPAIALIEDAFEGQVQAEVTYSQASRWFYEFGIWAAFGLGGTMATAIASPYAGSVTAILAVLALTKYLLPIWQDRGRAPFALQPYFCALKYSYLPIAAVNAAGFALYAKCFLLASEAGHCENLAVAGVSVNMIALMVIVIPAGWVLHDLVEELQPPALGH